jgi:hypothetical protein
MHYENLREQILLFLLVALAVISARAGLFATSESRTHGGSIIN